MKYLLVWHWILFTCLASAAQRPNILLIVSEDNGPELSCYGQPYVQTPVLDQLAKDGIRFERAYVPQAGCSQSRAAFLTGLYPHQNGQIGLATWKFRMYDENTPNLVRSLKSAGYRTGIIGKLHINPSTAFPFDFTAIPSANFGRKGMGQYAKKAKEFIHASEKPFFLSVNFPDAHRPFTPRVDGLPTKLLTENDVTPLAYFGLDSPELRRQTANYLNCMSRLDSQVGDLLNVLQASGKRKNTLVVYLGDHGADMLRGKRTSYEGGVRVPLIVSRPGKIVAGQVRDELVSTLDLMPTFLEAAGAPAIEGLPGRSLSPMFENCKVDWRQYLFTEFHTHSAHNYYPQRTVRDDRYKLIRNLMPNVVNPGYEFTRTKFFEELREVVAAAPEPVRSAYERMERPPEYELYDLEADPYEFVNLAENGEYQKVLLRLIRELEKWQTDTKDPIRHPKNVKQLGAEISNSFENGQPSKAKLKLTYPDYFFSSLQKNHRKNVLFIAVDDLRPALGCYGDKTAITPNIDKLASRGTVFQRAYCQEAVCAPSRLSLMTGRRPDTIKVWDLSTHFRETLPDVVTLPQHFKDSGYHTRSIGKIYHGSGKPSQDGPSWSVDPVYDSNHDPKYRYATEENLKGKGLKRNATESALVKDNRYLDGMICEEAVAALKEYEETQEPFFLAVGFKKPHLPFCAPKKYWDLYDPIAIPLPQFASHPEAAPELAWRSWKELEGYRDIPNNGHLTVQQVRQLRHGYYACVSYIYSQVGRLLEQLDATGLAENTVVCLLSDHGFHLGEQGIWTKSNNYELSTGVPLILVDPDAKSHGTHSDALVELVDVYPTLAELCDLNSPDGVEGISLVPLLEKPNRPWKLGAFSQFPRHRTSHRHRKNGDIMGYALRSKDYRYVEWRENETNKVVATEFYDHTQDDNESRNLASNPEFAKEIAKHSQILQNGWKAALPSKVEKPNVLFLAVDDMKDWVNCLGGYEGTVHTPNIDRLAARGTLFTNAHCPSPKCAPSRAAILSGLMPSTTGLYDNGHWWYPNLPNVISLPSYFQKNGYHVAGAGKIFHHTAGNHPPNQWDDFQKLVFRDDPWFRGVKLNYPWSRSGPKPKGFPFSGVNGLGHENDWGSLGYKESEYDDSRTAEYAVQFLSKTHDEPFFLACGLFRPHLPWYVPQKYFDQYPLEEVVLPKVKEDDLDDIPAAGKAFAKARCSDLTTIRKAGKYREAVQAYLASITYTDAQLGRVLDALDRSNQAENTIVVLWSDHGWHLGEKNHWHKTTLWDEATRVPFIISAPGFAASRCSKPVSLVDLYPTLLELCGFPPIKRHDGVSLVPLLDNPDTSWNRPAIVQFKPGNVAVRSERYRYIRYRDGGEEFYDLRTDPHEWTNLAEDPQFASQKRELLAWATKNWAPSAPTKGAFHFNSDSSSWKEKSTGRLINGVTKTQPQNP